MYKIKKEINRETKIELQQFISYAILNVMTSDTIYKIKEDSGKQLFFFPLKLHDYLRAMINKQICDKEYIYIPEVVDEFLSLFEDNKIPYALVTLDEHETINKTKKYPENFTIIGSNKEFMDEYKNYIITQ